jgi:phosphate transport system permease protein
VKNEIRIKIWLWGMPLISVVLFIAMLASLIEMALPSITHHGLKFLIGQEWDPSSEIYSALPFLVGTMVTSLLALLLATPLAVIMAIFVSEIVHTKLKKTLRIFVELMAGIPSIIIGLWGIFILIPILRDGLAPFTDKYFSFVPFLKGPSFGIGVFAATLVLAIMILPTISSICCEIFSTVPRGLKEAALALGATRYEMIKLTVIKPAFSGIISAMILGLARALGETMAVTMVIGNTPQIFTSLWEPGATLASIIANDYAEASSILHTSSLGFLALILMIFSFLMNRIANNIKKRMAQNRVGKQ